MSDYEIRPAERRDLAALLALAGAQASVRQALDPRLPATPHIIPFLSRAETLGDVLAWRHHVTLVAGRAGQVVAGINLHRVEQSDRDQFAAYYPRRFTSIGLLAAQPGAPATVLLELLGAARDQAARWKSEALLAHNAATDLPLRGALEQFGFRMFYHYALRPPLPLVHAPVVEPDRAAASPSFNQATAAVVSPARSLDTTASSAAFPDSAPAPFGRQLEPNPAARLAAKPALDGLSVRQATSADLDAVVAIGLESVRYHASLEPAMRVPRGEDHKMRRRFQEILRASQHAALFVAMLDWQIAGFYSLYLQSIDNTWTPPLFAPGRYGLIAEVAVAEGLRGRGIGHQLFSAVEQWFRERGAQRLWLIYLPRNPLSSRFWPSLGFQPVWDVMLSAI